MNDEEFRESYKPLQVPASIETAEGLPQKVAFALAEIGEGTADAVSRKLEELENMPGDKALIAQTHQTLTEWYDHGLIGATEHNGSLVYNLHKITHANDGRVDPDLLARGLD